MDPNSSVIQDAIIEDEYKTGDGGQDEFVNLEAELNKPTDEKKPPVSQPITEKKESTGPGADYDELGLEDESEDEESEDEELQNINPADFANEIIDTFDELQQTGGKFLYEKTLFTPQERADLRAVMRAFKASMLLKPDLTDYDKYLMSKATDIEEYEHKLPLKEREKKRIRKPLVKVLGKLNFKMTPEWALVITVVAIMLPRILPILGNLGDKWSGRLEDNSVKKYSEFTETKVEAPEENQQ